MGLAKITEREESPGPTTEQRVWGQKWTLRRGQEGGRKARRVWCREDQGTRGSLSPVF